MTNAWNCLSRSEGWTSLSSCLLYSRSLSKALLLSRPSIVLSLLSSLRRLFSRSRLRFMMNSSSSPLLITGVSINCACPGSRLLLKFAAAFLPSLRSSSKVTWLLSNSYSCSLTLSSCYLKASTAFYTYFTTAAFGLSSANISKVAS